MGKRKQGNPRHKLNADVTLNLLQPLIDQTAPVSSPQPVSKKKKKKCGGYEFLNDEIEEEFNYYLSSCYGFVKVHTSPISCRENLMSIGKFQIYISKNRHNEFTWNTGLSPDLVCYWYASTEKENSMFFFEEQLDKKEKKNGCLAKAHFLQVDSDVPESLFNAMKCQIVIVQCANMNFEEGIASMEVFLKRCVLSTLDYPSEIVKMKKTSVAIQCLMQFFYGLQESSYNNNPSEKKPDIEELYTAVQEIHAEKPLPVTDELQHESLLPQLREYQKKAVAWMLNQEKREDNREGQLHPLFVEFKTLDGKVLYYNKYGGIIVDKKPTVVTMTPGGILADEMGLGKTVEVLSCLLLNPRQNLPQWTLNFHALTSANIKRNQNIEEIEFQCICGTTEFIGNEIQCEFCGIWLHYDCIDCDEDLNICSFLCPHCQVGSDPIPSGATLIVTPMSIHHQWLEEIKKHLQKGSVKVFVYEGVNKQSYVHPCKLASFDIVVTTYQTLCKELNYVDLPHSIGKKFRQPKRFMTVPSPLVAVQWWRICLDEAQMVECTSTKTAEMASRLTALNRWCVTGTPIQKNIDDLYGLFLFLEVDPYWVQEWWNKLLYKPYLHGIKEPLFKAIASVLWRTAKKDVLNQINIPCQTERIDLLSFIPVEEHFYRRQYGECSKDAMKQLSKYRGNTTKLSDIDRKILSRILQPLVKLRQACCHPQAVRGEFQYMNKETMSMEELLESLIKKGTIECEETHRQAISTRHGLAGISIINDQLADAVNYYRDVLSVISEHEKYLRVDNLQLLHCYHNLHEILQLKSDGISHSLEDDKLPKKADDIRNKLTSKQMCIVKEESDNWMKIKNKIEDLEKQFEDPEWWSKTIDLIEDQNKSEALLGKIHDELESVDKDKASFIDHISTLTGLKYIVHNKLMAFTSARTKFLNCLKKHNGRLPTSSEINEAVSCCIRPKSFQLLTCSMCILRKEIEEYETCVYSVNKIGILFFDYAKTDHDQVLMRRYGNWGSGKLETLLKCIANFIPFLYRENKDLDEQSAINLKLFELYRKEYPLMNKLVLSLREQVRVYDEISMCMTRLRLPYPGEKRDKDSINVILPHECSSIETQLKFDKKQADNNLKYKLGQLFYLQNLAKKTDTDNSSPTQCIICFEALKTEWAVLMCGHFYCLSCMDLLVKRSVNYVKCATCRHTTHHNDINHVSTVSKNEISGLRIKGSHSTKVSTIVRCLMKMRLEDPTAKALVFSTWQSVLDIIGKALACNDIKYCLLTSAKKEAQKNLYQFKNDSDVVALLLPVHSGCNGLNLIEATHVILTEPILNPAQELQAIGRVHRIGQKKPTVIHRFFIKSTIEERMHAMLSNVKKNTPVTDRHDTTLTTADLFTLFGETPCREVIPEDDVLAENSTSIPTTPSVRSEIQQRCAMAALSRLSESVIIHPDLSLNNSATNSETTSESNQPDYSLPGSTTLN